MLMRYTKMGRNKVFGLIKLDRIIIIDGMIQH